MSSFWNGDGSQEVNVLTRVWQLNEQKMNKIEIYIYTGFSDVLFFKMNCCHQGGATELAAVM